MKRFDNNGGLCGIKYHAVQGSDQNLRKREALSVSPKNAIENHLQSEDGNTFYWSNYQRRSACFEHIILNIPDLELLLYINYILLSLQHHALRNTQETIFLIFFHD
jgi:hypothetical protein